MTTVVIAPMWIAMVVAFVVAAALSLGFKQWAGRLFVVLLAVMIAAALSAVFIARSQRSATIAVPSQVAVSTQIGVTHQSGQPVAVMAVPAGSPQAAPDPSLEELWDKLTKSRINLDGDAEEPVADQTDEKVKEAMGETFGLDNNGKLPPKWVITPPKQVGTVYRVSVTSDPWATEEECRQQLVENVLPQAVAKRIEYLAPSKVRRKVSVPDPLSLGIGPDYILSEICRDEFTGTVDSSDGEMKKVHVLLEFDDNIDTYLVDAWLRHERNIRLGSFGKIAALSLTGLAAVYGLLRFDTWSRGYYSKQLLVGGALAIIALTTVLLKS